MASNTPRVQTLITHFLHHLTSTTLPRLRAETGNPHAKIDAFVGLDARGFLFGPVLASRLGAAFVAVRKQGKLPGQCFKAEYEKECECAFPQRSHGRERNTLVPRRPRADPPAASSRSARQTARTCLRCKRTPSPPVPTSS